MSSALIVTFLAVTGGSSWGQVPRNPPPGGEPAAESPAAGSSKFLSIPGLSPLGMESVQRDIGITSEQKQQLQAASDSYVAAMQRLSKSFQQLSPEDQRKQAASFNSQAAQIARSVQGKAEAVLAPEQLQHVQRIAFQLSAAGALSDPALQEKLALSPAQRQQLNSVYEQAGEKMQKLQRDTATQVMHVLNAQQAADLGKLLDEAKEHRE
jgi:hypothetical protein